jgi:hypothetical protein
MNQQILKRYNSTTIRQMVKVYWLWMKALELVINDS